MLINNSMGLMMVQGKNQRMCLYKWPSIFSAIACVRIKLYSFKTLLIPWTEGIFAFFLKVMYSALNFEFSNPFRIG